MIAKFVVALCLFGLASASGWGGYSGLGYSSGLGYASGLNYGYSSYVAPAYTPVVKAVIPAYTAPVIKAVVPSYSYAPAVSTVSRYQVHSSPIIKSYVAPVSYATTYAAPSVVSYGHGYGNYGYGSKYLW